MEKYNTIEESRQAYKQYVDNHVQNVYKAFILFGEDILNNIEDFYDVRKNGLSLDSLFANVAKHDASKYGEKEFEAYRQRFNTCVGEVYDKALFDKAWEHHYMNNPHHPEHWVMNNGGYKIPMALIYVAEMLLDWIAMSIGFNDSLYDWWQGDKEKKAKLLTSEDYKFVDEFINTNKDAFNFKNNNVNELLKDKKDMMNEYYLHIRKYD